MSDAVVTTVKCVNTTPGSERYCCSVYFPVTHDFPEGGKVARVVVPYEEMGAVFDRVVDVKNLSVWVAAQYGSMGPIGFSDISVGVFDTTNAVTNFAGRYQLPCDQSLVEISDCGGAMVVSEGHFFGVRLSMGEVVPDYTGSVCVNFEFGLIGHSL